MKQQTHMATDNKTFDFNIYEKLLASNEVAGYDYARSHALVPIYEMKLDASYNYIYDWLKLNITDETELRAFSKEALRQAKSSKDKIKPAECYAMWRRGEAIKEAAAAAPNPDTESMMAAGASTSPQMKDAIASSASSVVSSAGGVVNEASAAAGSVISAAGVASSLASFVLSETVSYISEATTMIAQAGVTYTARLAADTPKKMASYLASMLPQKTTSLSEFVVPANIKDEADALKAQAAQKAAKMKEATSKITEVTSKITGVMEIAQAKVSYITKYAEDGPKKLEELGQNALYSALSYVGDMRDKAIKQIADWEENTSNVLAYDLAQKQAQKQADKINAQTKKAADELNKVKAKATIVAKKAIAVALSKIAALVGI